MAMNHAKHANPFPQYRIAVAFCFGLLIIALCLLWALGKTGSFTLINSHNHVALDIFFRAVTYLGDGLIFVPMVGYCIFFNRPYLVAVISGIIICTLLSQGIKHYVFPDAMRPAYLEAEQVIIHKIEGVPLHRRYSFPSGHTSIAFTVALLLTAVARRRLWSYVLPVLALLVGYSRIYLAQHFLSDVSAGMVIGIVSAYLSLLIYQYYKQKRGPIHPPRDESI